MFFLPSIFPCHSFRRRKRACKKRRRTKLFLLFKHTRARRNKIQTVPSDESMNHATKFNARNLFAEKFAENTFFVLLLLIPCFFLVFGWKRSPGAIFVYEIFGFVVSVCSVTMILNICTFLVFDFLLSNSHTSLMHAPLHARTVYTIKHIMCVQSLRDCQTSADQTVNIGFA